MTRYACSNTACPRRDPITASEPPTCYTCAQPMAVALATYDPSRAWVEFNGVRINGELQGPFVEIPARVHEDDFTAALAKAAEQGASWGGPGIIGFEVTEPDPPAVRLSAPEQTPEQRARRELGPITVTVTRPVIADPEAFAREIEAEILRVLTTVDRVPYDQPVSFRNEERIEDADPESPLGAGFAPMCMMCRKMQPGNNLSPQICEDCRATRDALFGLESTR